jgi:limonene-1,2-epoxide hydrolase
LLNYYICGNVIVAEWDASFNSNIENKRIHIREVGIFELKGNKIKSLREYYKSEKFDLK